VITHSKLKGVGYYTLVAAEVGHAAAPPVVRAGYLGTLSDPGPLDSATSRRRSRHGRGPGRDLPRNAMQRAG